MVTSRPQQIVLAVIISIACAACAPSPLSLGLLGAHTVAGVAGAADATRSPADKIRDKVGRDCVGYVFTSGGPACTSKLAKAGPLGISGTAPPHPQATSNVSNDPAYEDCMFRTIVGGKPGGC